MNQSLRILTASLTTFVVGSYLVYDTIQQNSLAYQSHPAVAVITAFWGASLSGLIYYFGIGWLIRPKTTENKGFPKNHFASRKPIYRVISTGVGGNETHPAPLVPV